MTNAPFDFAGRISEHDQDIAAKFIGSLYRPPDMVISPSGHGDYMYRWWVTPHSDIANVYFHIQTVSDPERPLHDHPWDSTSVILAGGYEELLDQSPGLTQAGALGGVQCFTRTPGDVIFRPGKWAHRLILPAHIPYSMSLFSTGPKVKPWGFWMEDGWRSFEEVTRTENGQSHWVKP